MCMSNYSAIYTYNCQFCYNSKHEVLTVHRMEEMMESVKKEMMDLKEETLRQ